MKQVRKNEPENFCTSFKKGSENRSSRFESKILWISFSRGSGPPLINIFTHHPGTCSLHVPRTLWKTIWKFTEYVRSLIEPFFPQEHGLLQPFFAKMSSRSILSPAAVPLVLWRWRVSGVCRDAQSCYPRTTYCLTPLTLCADIFMTIIVCF